VSARFLLKISEPYSEKGKDMKPDAVSEIIVNILKHKFRRAPELDLEELARKIQTQKPLSGERIPFLPSPPRQNHVPCHPED